MLQEVWRLSGQPSGKYLAVMDDTWNGSFGSGSWARWNPE